MNISQALDKLIVNNNYSNNKIYKITGISDTLIGCYRKGTRVPSLDNIIKLAELFNVSVDYLLGRDEPQKSPTIEVEDELEENLSEEDKQLDKQLVLIFHKLNRDGKRSVMASAIGASCLPEYANVESEEAATQIIA